MFGGLKENRSSLGEGDNDKLSLLGFNKLFDEIVETFMETSV